MHSIQTPGPKSLGRARTHDHMKTFDSLTIDSTGAFLVGELERLDQTMHEPLVSVSWGRDIDLREDVTIADEVSSYTNSTFASAGGINPTGKAWISKEGNAITGIALDIGKTASPLTLWAMELKWTIPELESAMKLGRPVDQQKYAGLLLKQQMDIDEQVYVGDTDLNFKGLVNNDATVTYATVAAGVSGSTLWSRKTPDEVLADVNTLMNATWAASGYAVMPTNLLLPPTQYGYIVSQKVSTAGNVSILQFLLDNNLLKTSTGRALSIQPVKWLIGAGHGGTIGSGTDHNRMVAYSKNRDRVRFPMTLLQRTPLEYRSLFQITTYFNRLGVVEFVYPETIQYADGI